MSKWILCIFVIHIMKFDIIITFSQGEYGNNWIHSSCRPASRKVCLFFFIKNQKTIFLFLQIFNNCDNFWTSGDSQARRVARHKNEVKQFPEFICVQIWIIRLSKSGGISRHADKEEQNLADVVEEVSLFRIHKYCLSVKTKFPLICHFREG